MQDSIEKLLAAVICIDGEVAASELSHLEKVASDFGFNKADLVKNIEAEIKQLEKMDEEEFQGYIQQAAKQIADEKTRYQAFDAALDVTLSDNSLDDSETYALASIAQHLGIPAYYFANNLAYQVKAKGIEVTCQRGWQEPPAQQN